MAASTADQIDDASDVSNTSEIKDRNENQSTSFHIRRIFGFMNYTILYALVFFHIACPSIISSTMAIDYNVPITKLSSFSSIYFYPYAIVQPFAGLFVDIIDPSYVLGGFQILSSIGSAICGFSKTLTVGMIGRLLIGLGAGPTYVCAVKIISNWFPLQYLAHFCGATIAIGQVGGIIAQGLLGKIVNKFGWRYAFFGIGIFDFLLSITELIFVRGDLTKLGYAPVNKEIGQTMSEDDTLKSRCLQLPYNLKTVISYPWFWMAVLYSFFCSGPYFDLSGMWAGPILTDLFNYSKSKADHIQIALSIGMILGCLTVPALSSLLHTRKWVLFAGSVIATISFALFTILETKLHEIVVIVLFGLIGMTTNSLTSVCYPLIREYFHPSIAGTAVGCANFFTFLSSAVFQNISSAIIAKFHLQSTSSSEDSQINGARGYRYGLFMVCVVSMSLSAIFISCTKDSRIEVDKSESESKEAYHDQVGSDLAEL